MSPLLVHILSQMNPVHTFLPYFPTVHTNIKPHPRLGLPSGLFLSGSPIKTLYTIPIFPTRATRAVLLILLDLITLIIFITFLYKLI